MLLKHGGKIVDTETGEIYSRRVGYTREKGYHQIYPSKGHTQQAHRFIWEAVNGPIPEGMQINHINGIKTDNRLVNLECVTPAGNREHALRTGLAKGQKGEAHHAAKLTNIRVLAIRALSDLGFTRSDIAARSGVSIATVSTIARREGWTHLPEHPARIEDL